MRRSRSWSIAVLAGLVVGLGGCSTSSGQSGSTTSTSAASESPSTSASVPSSAPASSPATTEPSIPDAARPATADGAQQFVTYWFQQFNQALIKPDPSLISQLSAADCPACQRFVAEAQQFSTSGKRVNGEMWTLTDQTVETFDNVGSAVIIADVRQNPVPLVDSSGTTISTYEAKSVQFAVTLARSGDSWRVARFQVTK